MIRIKTLEINKQFKNFYSNNLIRDHMFVVENQTYYDDIEKIYYTNSNLIIQTDSPVKPLVLQHNKSSNSSHEINFIKSHQNIYTYEIKFPENSHSECKIYKIETTSESTEHIIVKQNNTKPHVRRMILNNSKSSTYRKLTVNMSDTIYHNGNKLDELDKYLHVYIDENGKKNEITNDIIIELDQNNNNDIYEYSLLFRKFTFDVGVEKKIEISFEPDESLTNIYGTIIKQDLVSVTFNSYIETIIDTPDVYRNDNMYLNNIKHIYANIVVDFKNEIDFKSMLTVNGGIIPTYMDYKNGIFHYEIDVSYDSINNSSLLGSVGGLSVYFDKPREILSKSGDSYIGKTYIFTIIYDFENIDIEYELYSDSKLTDLIKNHETRNQYLISDSDFINENKLEMDNLEYYLSMTYSTNILFDSLDELEMPFIMTPFIEKYLKIDYMYHLSDEEMNQYVYKLSFKNNNEDNSIELVFKNDIKSYANNELTKKNHNIDFVLRCRSQEIIDSNLYCDNAFSVKYDKHNICFHSTLYLKIDYLLVVSMNDEELKNIINVTCNDYDDHNNRNNILIDYEINNFTKYILITLNLNENSASRYINLKINGYKIDIDDIFYYEIPYHKNANKLIDFYLEDPVIQKRVNKYSLEKNQYKLKCCVGKNIGLECTDLATNLYIKLDGVIKNINDFVNVDHRNVNINSGIYYFDIFFTNINDKTIEIGFEESFIDTFKITNDKTIKHHINNENINTKHSIYFFDIDAFKSMGIDTITNHTLYSPCNNNDIYVKLKLLDSDLEFNKDSVTAKFKNRDIDLKFMTTFKSDICLYNVKLPENDDGILEIFINDVKYDEINYVNTISNANIITKMYIENKDGLLRKNEQYDDSIALNCDSKYIYVKYIFDDEISYGNFVNITASFVDNTTINFEHILDEISSKNLYIGRLDVNLIKAHSKRGKIYINLNIDNDFLYKNGKKFNKTNTKYIVEYNFTRPEVLIKLLQNININSTITSSKINKYNSTAPLNTIPKYFLVEFTQKIDSSLFNGLTVKFNDELVYYHASIYDEDNDDNDRNLYLFKLLNLRDSYLIDNEGYLTFEFLMPESIVNIYGNSMLPNNIYEVYLSDITPSIVNCNVYENTNTNTNNIFNIGYKKAVDICKTNTIDVMIEFDEPVYFENCISFEVNGYECYYKKKYEDIYMKKFIFDVILPQNDSGMLYVKYKTNKGYITSARSSNPLISDFDEINTIEYNTIPLEVDIYCSSDKYSIFYDSDKRRYISSYNKITINIEYNNELKYDNLKCNLIKVISNNGKLYLPKSKIHNLEKKIITYDYKLDIGEKYKIITKNNRFEDIYGNYLIKKPIDLIIHKSLPSLVEFQIQNMNTTTTSMDIDGKHHLINLMDISEYMGNITLRFAWECNNTFYYDIDKLKIYYINDDIKNDISLRLDVNVSPHDGNIYEVFVHIKSNMLKFGEYKILFEKGFIYNSDVDLDSNEWVYSLYSHYSGGDGTVTNPYCIESLKDLYNLSLTSEHWDKHIIQTHDIDFNRDKSLIIEPIGNDIIPFTGVYNGLLNSIHNIHYNSNEMKYKNYVGLFGNVNRGILKNIKIRGRCNAICQNNFGVLTGLLNKSIVKNIDIELNSSIITVKDNSGIVCGEIIESYLHKILIVVDCRFNCGNNSSGFAGTITQSKLSSISFYYDGNFTKNHIDRSTGLFTTTMSDSNINDIIITSIIPVNSKSVYTGAIIGKMSTNSSINAAKMNINGTIRGNYVGGIIGKMDKNSSLSNININIEGNIFGFVKTGGLIGHMEDSFIYNTYLQLIGSISSIYNEVTNEIKTAELNDLYGTGGLVGYSYNSVIKHAGIIQKGNISAEWDTNIKNENVNIGGLIGRSINSTFMKIYNSINGDIYGKGLNIGGLAGYISNNTKIYLSYNAMSGDIIGDNNVGGLVGGLSNSSSYNNIILMHGKIKLINKDDFTIENMNTGTVVGYRNNIEKYVIKDNLVVTTFGLKLMDRNLGSFSMRYYIETKKLIAKDNNIIQFNNDIDFSNNEMFYHTFYEVPYIDNSFCTYASMNLSGVDFVVLMIIDTYMDEKYIEGNIMNLVDFKVICPNKYDKRYLVRDMSVILDNNRIKELISSDKSYIQLENNENQYIKDYNHYRMFDYDITIDSSMGYIINNTIYVYDKKFTLNIESDKLFIINSKRFLFNNINLINTEPIKNDNIICNKWKIDLNNDSNTGTITITEDTFADMFLKSYKIHSTKYTVINTYIAFKSIFIVNNDNSKIDIFKNRYNLTKYNPMLFTFIVSTNRYIDNIDSSKILINKKPVKTTINKTNYSVKISINIDHFSKGTNNIILGPKFMKSMDKYNDKFIIKIDKLFSGGLGIANDPYLISNRDDLIYIASNERFWNKNNVFSQTKNINMEGIDFSGIGKVNKPFNGLYNGYGQVIENLYIYNNDQLKPVGLFNLLGGRIIDVKIHNITINTNSHCGGIVGYTNSSARVEYCSIYGVIMIASHSKNIGGLIGVNNGNLIKCSQYGEGQIEGKTNVGGLIGLNTGFCSQSFQSMKGVILGNNYVGGLSGKQQTSGITNQCYVSMNGTIGSLAPLNAGSSFGGLIGYQSGVLRCNYNASYGVVNGYPISNIMKPAIEQDNYFIKNDKYTYFKRRDEEISTETMTKSIFTESNSWVSESNIYNVIMIDDIPNIYRGYIGLNSKYDIIIGLQISSEITYPILIQNVSIRRNLYANIFKKDENTIIETSNSNIGYENFNNNITVINNLDKKIYYIHDLDDFLVLFDDSGEWSKYKKIELLADIDFGNTLLRNVIGNKSNPFNCEFNGNGYTISNINIKCINEDNVGIFGYTSGSAIIEDLNISGNINIVGENNVGVLIGCSVKTYVFNCNYNYDPNEKVMVNITGKTNVGFMVGTVYMNSVIESCNIILPSISFKNVLNRVGIISGAVYGSSTIKDMIVYVDNNISIYGNSIKSVGGLYGAIVDTSLISNNILETNNGSLIIYSDNSKNNTQISYVGGMIGFMSNNCSIIDSTQKINGNIQCKNESNKNKCYAEFIAGFIGYIKQDSIIRDCNLIQKGTIFGNDNIAIDYNYDSNFMIEYCNVDSRNSNIILVNYNI